MGDFLGFTFGDIHSSNLGITRVSGGDRYEEQLHPEIKDRTVEVPGLNGEYYFGSDFGTRTFDIEIAFDHLTEEQFRKLRQTFGTKDIKRLIFDERPYKYYMAKLESPIELSYISFDEPNYTWQKEQTGYNTYMQGISGDYEHKVYDGTVRRIYKGEGKISFISYFPFARSVFKQLPYVFQLTTDTIIQNDKKYFVYDSTNLSYERVVEPIVSEIENYYERVNEESTKDWAVSSGILSVNEYEEVDKCVEGNIKIYNAGDIATGFRLYIPNTILTNTITLTYKLDNNTTTATLTLQTMSLKDNDIGILVDTNNGLITGVSTAPTLNPNSGEYSYITSGNLYNRYVDSGYFFHLEPNNLYPYSTLQVTNGTDEVLIFYDYLYF